MSKFLQSRPNLNAVLDGSLAIFGATIGASNLTPGFPVRVDPARRLYSTTLAESDITGLVGDLTNLQTKTQNISGGTTAGNTSFSGVLQSTSAVESNAFTMVQLGLTPSPVPNRGFLWSDTSDQLHYATIGGGDKIVSLGGPYLPLAGGTMTGGISMGGQEISNCTAIRTSGSNIVYGNTASAAGANSVVIGDSAQSGFGGGSSNTAIGQGAQANYLNSVAIGSGAVANSESVVIGSGSSGSSSYNVIIGSGATGSASKAVIIGRQAIGADNSIAIGNLCSSGTNFGVTIGAFSNCGAGDSVIIGHNSYSNVNNANIIGSNLTNGTGDSLLVAASANIRANTTTCNLGTVASPFQSLYLNGSIAGPTYSRTADNIVSNSGSSTSGNLASFSGSSGKIVTDSGIVAANVVTNSGASISGRLASFSTISGKIITDSGVLAANVVTNSGASISGRLASFSGATGKIVTDSGVLAANVVTNTGGTVTSGQIATFSGTTGRLLTNSTTPILGTPASGTLTNCTGLPISTGVSGLAINVATMLGSFTSATVYNALPVTNGTGYLVFDTNPDFTGATQRLQPLKLSTLTQYEAFTIAGSTTPTSYITANSVGTRFYAANTTNIGMVIKIRSFAQLNSWTGGGTLTISFYLNGAANIVLNVPAGTAAGSYLNADFDCTIRGTNLCRTQGVLLASGQYPVIMDGGGTWTKTSSNNVDVLFTFSIGSGGNMISPLGLTIETHYQK